MEEIAPKSKGLFDHPETKSAFFKVFENVPPESDRGAVLIAQEIISSELTNLFKELAPKDEIANKMSKEIFRYPQPMSSFAAKVRIAYYTGLINDPPYTSIQILREIRNEAAHSDVTFSLSAYHPKLKNIYKLGDGVPAAIERWAAAMFYGSVVGKTSGDLKLDDEPVFTNVDQVDKFLDENPGLKAKIGARLYRYELSIGVSIICALIILRKQSLLERRRNGV